jgi:hypothetical protein
MLCFRLSLQQRHHPKMSEGSSSRQFLACSRRQYSGLQFPFLTAEDSRFLSSHTRRTVVVEHLCYENSSTKRLSNSHLITPSDIVKSQEVDGEGDTVDIEGRLFEGHSDEQDDKSEGIGGNDEDFGGKESSVVGGLFAQVLAAGDHEEISSFRFLFTSSPSITSTT